jgi:hypothetical protein
MMDRQLYERLPKPRTKDDRELAQTFCSKGFRALPSGTLRQNYSPVINMLRNLDEWKIDTYHNTGESLFRGRQLAVKGKYLEAFSARK